MSAAARCLECKGDLERAEAAPLLACVSCGRVYRTDRGPGLTYTGTKYSEISEYARLLGVRIPEMKK